jgi:hypothetical protein
MLTIPIDRICIEPRFRKNLGDIIETINRYTETQSITNTNEVDHNKSLGIDGWSLPEDYFSKYVRANFSLHRCGVNDFDT